MHCWEDDFIELNPGKMSHIKRNYISIITFIVFLLIIILFGFEWIDEKLFLGLLGVIATLYFGLLKQKSENDKLFKELFNTFNERYDNKFNDLLNELREDSERKLKKDEKNLVIDYFNLCAEEYLWYSQNRIHKRVWVAWKAGIKSNLEIKQIAELFHKETATSIGRVSFYGVVEELNKQN